LVSGFSGFCFWGLVGLQESDGFDRAHHGAWTQLGGRVFGRVYCVRGKGNFV